MRAATFGSGAGGDDRGAAGRGPPVQGGPALLGAMTPQEIAAVFRAVVPLISWTRPRFRVPGRRGQLVSRRWTEAGSGMPSRRSGAASGCS
jgi:hypothetical protein